MPDHLVNLLNSETQPTPLKEQLAPLPRRKRRTILFITIIFFVALGTFLTTNIVMPGVRLSYRFGGSSFWEQLRHLTFSSDRDITGQEDDRINILLMGMGGAGHDGPLLTDTIMLLSIKPSSKQVALISIPRDLSIPYPDGSWRRINEAYSAGEVAKSDHGGDFAVRTIGPVLGVSIPYYLIVDFNGFQKIIDDLSGVHVYVDRSFSDDTFPKDDKAGNVETVAFDKGWQWMDGKEALMFARSRHGNNGEGSDFARAKRQQKILLAIKDRFLSSGVIFNPIAINRLVDGLEEHIATNIEPWQMISLYRMIGNVSDEQIKRASLDDSPEGLLVNTRGFDGAYLLAPKGGDFNIIQQLIKNIFSSPASSSSKSNTLSTSLEIQNGTSLPGLAANVSKKFSTLGFTITRTTNAAERPVSHSIIYDLTNGAKPQDLAKIKTLIDAEVITTMPAWLSPSIAGLNTDNESPTSTIATTADTDFIIIIGSDTADDLAVTQ